MGDIDFDIPLLIGVIWVVACFACTGTILSVLCLAKIACGPRIRIPPCKLMIKNSLAISIVFSMVSLVAGILFYSVLSHFIITVAGRGKEVNDFLILLMLISSFIGICSGLITAKRTAFRIFHI